MCGKKTPEETETQPILAMETGPDMDDGNDIVSMRDKDTMSIKTEADSLSEDEKNDDDDKKDDEEEEELKKDDDDDKVDDEEERKVEDEGGEKDDKSDCDGEGGDNVAEPY